MKIIKNFSKFPIFEKVAEFPIFEKVSAVQDKIRKAGNTSDPLLLRICAMEDVSPELNWNLINDEEGLLAKVSSEYENKIKGLRISKLEDLGDKYKIEVSQFDLCGIRGIKELTVEKWKVAPKVNKWIWV